MCIWTWWAPPHVTCKHRYLLTAIDRSTRWFEAVPLADISAETVLEAFIRCWVARFGVPKRVTSDMGTQFTSSTWSSWCEYLQVEHITTTAFHPQSNGMVERLHRQIKDALRARGASTEWESHLLWLLLGLRTAPKEESGISTSKATQGQQLVVPGQAHTLHVEGLPAAHVPPAVIPATKRSYAEVAASPASPLDSADWVYVRQGASGRPLVDNYQGPFRVLERGQKSFKLQMGERVDQVSRYWLKPHRAVKSPEPAVKRPHGRPPRDGD